MCTLLSSGIFPLQAVFAWLFCMLYIQNSFPMRNHWITVSHLLTFRKKSPFIYIPNIKWSTSYIICVLHLCSHAFSRHFYPKDLVCVFKAYIFQFHIFPGNRTHDLGDATPSFSEKPVYKHRRITFNQSFLQSISTERSPDTVNCSFYVAIFLIEISVSKDDLKRWFERSPECFMLFWCMPLRLLWRPDKLLNAF